jgi:hypothetical protein
MDCRAALAMTGVWCFFAALFCCRNDAKQHSTPSRAQPLKTPSLRAKRGNPTVVVLNGERRLATMNCRAALAMTKFKYFQAALYHPRCRITILNYS